MPRKRRATNPALTELVALVGIEQGGWRIEAGESLSGAPDDLDLAWLLSMGRVEESLNG